MANLSLSRVNQKLAYARAMLKQASALASPATASERLQIQAMLDAAVFHLVCGFTHYVREIAENYRVKDVSPVNDCSSLLLALAAIDKEPAEAVELSLLSQDATSWLAQMQSYYQSLWSVAQAATESRDRGEGVNLIAAKIIQSSDDLQEVDLEIVHTWERSFTTLVARQRETSSEY